MIHATTVLSVRHRNDAVMASDGQVTFGNTVVKQSAKKIRKLYNERILAGFAGSAADSFALFSRFESKLEQHRGNLRDVARRGPSRWCGKNETIPGAGPEVLAEKCDVRVDVDDGESPPQRRVKRCD